MGKPWLLVDANNLCHRAHHSTGNMAYNGKPTGVAYGVLRDVKKLTGLYGPCHWVFAFDGGKSLRKKLYPAYKAKRPRDGMDAVFAQIDEVRTDILPRLGFRNVLHAPGYEADDLIARISRDIFALHRCVIVSGDKDLFQCLGPNTDQYLPGGGGREYREWDLMQEYGVGPKRWAQVKAIGGCSSDNIKGVKGVGEVTAAKYVKDPTLVTDKVRARIKGFVDFGKDYEKNLSLTTLPLPGTPDFDLRDDDLSDVRWNRVLRALGIRSL